MTIQVKDMNDEMPKFQRSTMTLSVQEGLAVKSEIHIMNIRDLDTVNKTYTVDFGYKGPGQLVPYIRISLITDGNYVHSGQTDRKNRPS